MDEIYFLFVAFFFAISTTIASYRSLRKLNSTKDSITDAYVKIRQVNLKNLEERIEKLEKNIEQVENNNNELIEKNLHLLEELNSLYNKRANDLNTEVDFYKKSILIDEKINFFVKKLTEIMPENEKIINETLDEIEKTKFNFDDIVNKIDRKISSAEGK
jgi:uncharacterized protein YoxC